MDLCNAKGFPAGKEALLQSSSLQCRVMMAVPLTGDVNFCVCSPVAPAGEAGSSWRNGACVPPASTPVVCLFLVWRPALLTPLKNATVSHIRLSSYPSKPLHVFQDHSLKNKDHYAKRGWGWGSFAVIVKLSTMLQAKHCVMSVPQAGSCKVLGCWKISHR